MTTYSLIILLSQFWTSPCSISGSNCCFLIHIEVSQEMGKVVWHSHLLKNFSTVCCDPHIKGFSIVNEAELDVFLDFLCCLHDLLNVGPLISGSFAFSKPSLYIWKFPVHILLKPNLKDFEHSLGSIWNKNNYTVVWTLFDISLLWDWNEKWPFPVPWPLLAFPNLLTYWVQRLIII